MKPLFGPLSLGERAGERDVAIGTKGTKGTKSTKSTRIARRIHADHH